MAEECDLFVALIASSIKRYLEKEDVYSASMIVNSPEVSSIISDPFAVSNLPDFMIPYIEKFDLEIIESIRSRIISLDISRDILEDYNSAVLQYNCYVDICAALRFRDSCMKLEDVHNRIKQIHTAILCQLQEPVNPPRYGSFSNNRPDDDLPF